MRPVRFVGFVLFLACVTVSMGFAADGWIGPCGHQADCDDGSPCTVDSCNTATGSCDNEVVAPECCQNDADCFDGDPCTVEWCAGTHPNSHCESRLLYSGCCYDGQTEYCDPAHDPCYSGECDVDLHVDFGGCTLSPLCCSTDMQCSDQSDATLDRCDTNVCQFESSSTWCNPAGACPSGGKKIEQLSGFDMTHFLDCDTCITRPLWEQCQIETNCPGEGCCETDSDCRGLAPESQNTCDTTTPCTVNDQGIPVGNTSGTCIAAQVTGCVEPRDCVTGAGGDPADLCEPYSLTLNVPVCHSPTDSLVSETYYCDEENTCQRIGALCSTDADCAINSGCLEGSCGKLENEPVGKCVYLPKKGPDLLESERLDIQSSCMDAHACKRVTCGLDFRGGPEENQCPSGLDHELACTAFGPGYSRCVSQQLQDTDHECCTNDDDCDDADPATVNRCIDNECAYPVKQECTTPSDCCECYEIACDGYHWCGGCVGEWECIDGGPGYTDYCYPHMLAPETSSCAYHDDTAGTLSPGVCTVNGECDVLAGDPFCLPDGNSCTVEVWDAQTSSCVSQSVADGIPCKGSPSGPNACKLHECVSGQCVPTADDKPDETSCDTETTCSVSKCESGSCVWVANALAGAPCRGSGNSNPCQAYTCDDTGSCIAAPLTPNDPPTPCSTACGSGVCVDGACSITVPVSDWDWCKGPEDCRAYACLDGECTDLSMMVQDGAVCGTADGCQVWTCQSGECRFDASAAGTCAVSGSCRQWQCADWQGSGDVYQRCLTLTAGTADPSLCAEPGECVQWSCADDMCVVNASTCGDTDECNLDLCASDAENCLYPPKTCDDSVTCTDDSCDPAIGCVYEPNPGHCPSATGMDCTLVYECDPALDCQPVHAPYGVPCLADEPCRMHICDGIGNCEILTENAADGAPCSPGDASDPCRVYECFGGQCHYLDTDLPDGEQCAKTCGEAACGVSCGTGTCQSGQCAYDPPGQTGTRCDATDPCKTYECSGGSCQETGTAADGTECPSPDPCHIWTCQGGACKSDLDNPATPAIGSACFFQRGCWEGQCSAEHYCELPSQPVVDLSPCWADTMCVQWECAEGACAPLAVDPLCDDEVWCTGEYCVADGKVCTSIPDDFLCAEGNICIDDWCAPYPEDPAPSEPGGGCHHEDNVDPCDDSVACTHTDTCAAGSCSGTPYACEDGDVCTDDICDSVGGCLFPFNQAVCNDGDPCTHTDVCSQGVCAGTAYGCDDSNGCTDDSCLGDGTCEHSPNQSACNDDDPCTHSDICDQGECSGTSYLCDDSNVCTNDNCLGDGNCSNEPNQLPCDDGNACTEYDVCSGGACAPGTPLTCDDENRCTDDSCSPASGCTFVNNNQNSCELDDVCLLGEECVDGVCMPSDVLDCDDGKPCTSDYCHSQEGCKHPFAGAVPCNDYNPCTTSDRCTAIDRCEGTPPTVIPVAYVHGQVFDSDTETPLAGVQIRPAGRTPLGCSMDETVVTDGQGRFELPVAQKGLYVVEFVKEGYIPGQREISVVDTHRLMGRVYLAPLSSYDNIIPANVTGEMTATSGADDNVQIIIPDGTQLSCPDSLPQCCTAGDCTQPTCCGIENDEVDIRITWYDRGDELPGPLPETSYFTYAFSTHPEGLQFSNPVTVKLRNTPMELVWQEVEPGQWEWVPQPIPWANPFPAGKEIPVGLWNRDTGQWEHATQATVTGTWIEFTTDHFSAWDANLPALTELGSDGAPVSNESDDEPSGNDDDEGVAPIEPPCEGDPAGSSIGRADGSLQMSVELPGTMLDGEFYGLSFTYDSRTAYPQLYLASGVDLSVFQPGEFPELLGFGWELAGTQGHGFYTPADGYNRMATVVPARDYDGQWLSTGPRAYYLTIGTKHVGEYFWTGKFGEPPVPNLPSEYTGRPPRENYWQHSFLSGTSLIVNHRGSPFGAGWSLDGLLTLHEDDFSGDRMIVEGADSYIVRGVNRVYKVAGVHADPADLSEGDGGSKYEAKFQYPRYLAKDDDGNTYVAGRNIVRKISADGFVTTIAGCGTSVSDCQNNYPDVNPDVDEFCEPGPGTGETCELQPATRVYLDGLRDIEVDSSGNIYLAVYWEDTIRRVDPTGLLHTVAGNPLEDCSDDCCQPTGIAIDEKANGVYVYYASGLGTQTVKRAHPGDPGAVDDVLGPGKQFASAQDIILLSSMDPADPGPGFNRTILVAEQGDEVVTRVDFVETPVYGGPQGELTEWTFSTGTESLFAGNGTAVQVPFVGGNAQMIAIGGPRGLAERDEDTIYMSVYGNNSKDMILRAGRIYDEVAEEFIWKIARVAGAQTGAEDLSSGADPLDIPIGDPHGLLWDDGNSTLLFPVLSRGSVWRIATTLDGGHARFVKLEQTGEDTRQLWEKNGTKHDFETVPGTQGQFRVTRTEDRWGRPIEYAYDSQSGALEKVFLPHERAYVLSYGPAGTLDSAMLSSGCSVADCSSPTPLWEDQGQPQPVLFDVDANHQLVEVDYQTGDEKRQFDYDADHRMTMRYHGENMEPPAEPEKSVEYVWDGGVVRRVVFDDGVQSWNNREYVHSRERGLMAPDGSNATESSPLQQDELTGWDLTTDAEGNQLWTRLNTAGQTEEIKDDHGRRTVITRGEHGLPVKLCQYASEAAQDCDYVVEYTYDDSGRILSESVGYEETRSVWRYGYEGSVYDLPTYLLNAMQELTRLVYDAQGNLTEVRQLTTWTEDNGQFQSTGLEYVAKWFYDEAVAPPGRPVAFQEPTCVAASGVDCEVGYEYGAGGLGNITRIVKIAGGDPNETTDDVDVTIDYDELGFTQQVHVPYESGDQKQTAAWSMTHDKWGKVTTATNPQGAVWTYDYSDPMAQGCSSCTSGPALGSVLGPDGTLAVLERDFAGRVTAVKTGYRDAGGDHFLSEKTYQYDLGGKLTHTAIENTDAETTLTYDDLERLTNIAVASGPGTDMQWQYVYDALGRTGTVTTPDQGQWQLMYDHLSTVTSIEELDTDRVTTLQRDQQGRVTSRTIGAQVGTDPTWSYVRDSVGRLKQVQHPTGTPLEQSDLTRDESGNITEVKRDGDTTDEVTRDSYGRVTSVSRTYQQPDLVADYAVEYDWGGKVKSVDSQIGENGQQEAVRLKHQYTYNTSAGLDSVTLHRKEGTGAWGSAILDFNYAYDNMGRLERIELDAPSAAIQFYRDEAGRIDRIDYEAASVVKDRVQVAYADHTSWLASLTMGTPDGEGVDDPPLLQLAYVYDAAGRIVRIDETGEAGPDTTRILTYDDASRLKGAEDHHGYPDEDAMVWEYTYSKAGERESKTVDTNVDTYQWDSPGMLDQVTGTSTRDFTFDNAGNLTSITQGGDTLQFAYDKSGRVNSVTDGLKTVDYRYGPDERRVGKTINGTTTTRYFTDGLVTYEIDGATTEIQRAYVFLPDGYTPIMLVTFNNGMPDKVYFYLNDHLSTPRIVTNDTGQGVWRARYAPFGQRIEQCYDAQEETWDAPCPLVQPIRFPGQWDDGVPGVWYNWHRFYLPEYGIYGRVDPVFQVGAQVWDYVGGNPVASIDPTGLINSFSYGNAEYWNRRARTGEQVGKTIIHGLGNTLKLFGSALLNLAAFPFTISGCAKFDEVQEHWNRKAEAEAEAKVEFWRTECETEEKNKDGIATHDEVLKCMTDKCKKDPHYKYHPAPCSGVLPGFSPDGPYK